MGYTWRQFVLFFSTCLYLFIFALVYIAIITLLELSKYLILKVTKYYTCRWSSKRIASFPFWRINQKKAHIKKTRRINLRNVWRFVLMVKGKMKLLVPTRGLWVHRIYCGLTFYCNKKKEYGTLPVMFI